jgi:ribosomal protein S18 acetylase RimI-like enzyme
VLTDQPGETVRYVPMSLERHNPRAVAFLIHESAPELFALMFGPCAIGCLTELVQRSHNQFSYRYIHIAEINRKVVGLATLIPAARVNDGVDYLDALSVMQKIWLNLIQRFLLPSILRQDYPSGGFYIGNLAVTGIYRNQGIGGQLLKHCIAEATVRSSTVFISVSVSNGRAQKLYESLGFQVVGMKTIRLFGITLGSNIFSIP